MKKFDDLPVNQGDSRHPSGEGQPNSIPPDDIDWTNVREQRGVILSILIDFLEPESIGQLGSWIAHVGFDLKAIRYPADLPAAWLAHYRQGRGYNVERALNDLVTWPPIARQIALPLVDE